MAKLGLNILVEKTIGLEPVKDFVNDTYDAIFDKMIKCPMKSLYTISGFIAD
jgi:hypothetical protein